MYWEETQQTIDQKVPDDVVDLVFNIRCRSLPVDHAYALSQSILAVLPWLADEPQSAVHTIHVAETANGWIRPDGADDILYLSKRTKFTLRVPKHRVEEAKSLVGRSLTVVDNTIELTKVSVKSLSPITTIFARYVVTDGTVDESDFMERTLVELRKLGVKPKKMLCGVEKTINTPENTLKSRSLMIANLNFEETVLLQQRGLGSYRLLGCGIFLPHKDINEISEELG